MRFKYELSGFHDQLFRKARAQGLSVHIDAEGYLCASDDEEIAIQSIRSAIEDRVLIERWSFLAQDAKQFAAKRDELDDRGVPYLAFESDHSKYGHRYGLAIRKESSLPPSKRPWSKS